MKNQFNILLKDAYKAFRKSRYSEAIVLLEKISDSSRNPYPLFLLTVSYLLANRFKQADISINKVIKTDPDYLPLSQLKSFLFLKSASGKEQVIAFYLEQQEKFPEDRYLNKALKVLYKINDFKNFQKKANLYDFVRIPKPVYNKLKDRISYAVQPPQKNKRKYTSSFIFIFIILIAVAALTITVFYYLPDIKKIKLPMPEKKKNVSAIDSVNINFNNYSLIDKIKTKGTPVFYYSDKSVKDDFNQAKQYIKEEKYNRALLIINKISNSNVNYRVFEKTDFLFKYIKNIGNRDFDEYNINEIVKSPYLYNNVFLKLKGRVANLKKSGNEYAFNLLIDYEKDDKFSGIADVIYENEKPALSNGESIILHGIFNYMPGEKSYIAAKNVFKEKLK